MVHLGYFKLVHVQVHSCVVNYFYILRTSIFVVNVMLVVGTHYLNYKNVYFHLSIFTYFFCKVVMECWLKKIHVFT